MMDINDFIRDMNERFGTSDEDWNGIRKSGIVSFEYDERGNVSGKYKGMVVFRNRNYENVILPGETWICSLELNPQSLANYFAKPLQRIDAPFIFELLEEQMENIADFIWDKHRDTLEPMMDERYRSVLNEKISAAVTETKAECEVRIIDMISKIKELELRDMENGKIINSLQSKVSNTEQARIRSADVSSDMILDMDISVRRIGPDSIASEFFSRSRYYVHLSADYRVMIAVPHEKGDVVCIDGVIELNGLNTVSPFSEPYDMVSEYNPKYGGVQIHLR